VSCLFDGGVKTWPHNIRIAVDKSIDFCVLGVWPRLCQAFILSVCSGIQSMSPTQTLMHRANDVELAKVGLAKCSQFGNLSELSEQ